MAAHLMGRSLLAAGLVVVVAVVTSSVTGSAVFFESFCGVSLTAMLWVLPSGAFNTGDCAAAAVCRQPARESRRAWTG